MALKRPDLPFVTFSSFAKENENFGTMVNASNLLILFAIKKRGLLSLLEHYAFLFISYLIFPSLSLFITIILGPFGPLNYSTWWAVHSLLHS